MRVNRPVWPVLLMILAGLALDNTGILILGIILGVLWGILETFDGEVP